MSPGRSASPPPRVSVLMPVYEAQEFLAEAIDSILTQTFEDFELLVVDDGSTDGTAAAARVAGARVVRHPANLGKGRALLTAFEDLFERGYAQVLTLDADGQHRPDQIPVLLQAGRAEAGLVIGSRAHLFREMHGVRRVSNRLSSIVISAVAGRTIADVQSGFRLYSRRLIEVVGFPEPRYEAESAIVVRAARLGFPVVSVPIQLGYADGRSTSHYRPVIDSMRIAGAVSQGRRGSP